MGMTPLRHNMTTPDPIHGRTNHNCFVAALSCAVAAAATLSLGQIVEPATTNAFSRPVGFMRIELPPTSYRLAAMPFAAFDPHVNVLLKSAVASHDAGHDTAPELVVYKWDALSQSYTNAYLADLSGRNDVVWGDESSCQTPSTMTLHPGDGFCVHNRGATAQDIFLSGEVVLNASNGVMFTECLNLFGYPFTTARRLDNSALGSIPDGDVWFNGQGCRTNTQFALGQGYWYVRSATNGFVWNEPRPYANPFPTNAGPPRIVSLTPSAGQDAVTLGIVTSGDPRERFDIFYQDLTPTSQFDTVRGWIAAARNLAPHGATLSWTDMGGNGRPSVSAVSVRIYLVAHSGCRIEEDGFLTQWSNRQTSENRTTDNAISSNMQPANQSNDGRVGATNTNSLPLTSHLRPQTPVVYVDAIYGDDTLDGRSRSVASQSGPKRTIAAGRVAVQDGGSLCIQTGVYRSDLSIAGKNVHVVIQGDVKLK